MLFAISKLLNFFTSPINWILGLVVLAVIVKKGRTKILLLSGALLLALVFTNGWLQVQAIRAWSKPYCVAPDTSTVYDLAVVLGGSTGYSIEWKEVDYNKSADRMTEAIRLYRLGRIKKILLSGESAINIIDGVTYAPYFLKYMEQMGVNPQDILLEQKARTTRENIALIGQLVNHKNNSPILVISSGWHLRRVMKGFKESGLNIVPYGVDVPSPEPVKHWYQLLPSWEVTQDWQQLIHEIIGMAVIS